MPLGEPLCGQLRRGILLSPQLAIDYALSFNDSEPDYVDCGSDDSLKLTQWTLECQFNATLLASKWYRLIVKSNVSIYDLVLQISGSITPLAGYLSCGFYDTGDNWRSSPLAKLLDLFTLNVWHHVVATFDGQYIKLYFDGVLKITSSDLSAYTPRTNSIPLWIGRITTTYDMFTGLADEFRVYNRALSLTEIQHNMYSKTPVLDGLVLWLPMDEGEGDTVYDKSGYDNNGTIHGATWVKK